MVGPVIGGFLVAAGGAPWAIAIDAASYGVSALCLALVAAQPQQPQAADESFVRQIVLGWHEFRSRNWLWISVVQFALFHMLCWGPLMVLGAWQFAHVAHGASRWGGVLAAVATGAVLGGVIGLHWRPRRPLLAAQIGFLPFASLLAALAASAPYGVCIASGFAAGIGSALFGVLWETLLGRKIPPRFRARIGAYDAFGSLCLLPAGYAMAGPMAVWMGADGALWFSSAFVVLSTLVAIMPRAVRDLDDSAIDA
jgi:hypothetical protein